MKNILLATVVLGLVSCTSQKKLETSGVPFEIGQSTYQETLGGRAESGIKSELKINVTEAMQDMFIEKVFFRGHTMECELQTEDGISAIVASYKSNKTSDTDSDKEGKQIQKIFKLGPNEAVIAFKNAEGDIKYAKVEDVKEKAPILMRSKPKN